MTFFESGKSVISIVNGILILVIFLKKPLSKWWHRNIASRRNKIIFKVDSARESFRCVEKNLISEIEFDCPPQKMDDGSIKLFVREYRFKIEALIYGAKFCNLFSVQKNIELTVIHNKKEYAMFPLFIEREGKDTRTLLISFKTLNKPPNGSIVKIKLPQSNSAESFITSTLLNLPTNSWNRIYREKIEEAERRYKNL
jgi:hypothetical protein